MLNKKDIGINNVTTENIESTLYIVNFRKHENIQGSSGFYIQYYFLCATANKPK